MKKILILTSLISPPTPFAFWKLEGPFIARITYNKQLLEHVFFHKIYTKEDLNALNANPYMNEGYIIFLYNQNSNYLFSSTSTSNISELENILSFFEDPEKNINTSIESLNFFLMKSSLLAINKQKQNSFLNSGAFKINFFQDSNNIYQSKITLSQEINTNSGIKIENPIFNINKENKKNDSVPIISNNTKKIKFQNAIQTYFNQDLNYTEISMAIIQSKIENSENIYYNMKKIVNNMNTIGKHELNLLEKSTILTIWGVFKDKKHRNSILVGLAQDDTSKKRFHWVTDLKKDIYTLLD